MPARGVGCRVPRCCGSLCLVRQMDAALGRYSKAMHAARSDAAGPDDPSITVHRYSAAHQPLMHTCTPYRSVVRGMLCDNLASRGDLVWSMARMGVATVVNPAPVELCARDLAEMLSMALSTDASETLDTFGAPAAAWLSPSAQTGVAQALSARRSLLLDTIRTLLPHTMGSCEESRDARVPGWPLCIAGLSVLLYALETARPDVLVPLLMGRAFKKRDVHSLVTLTLLRKTPKAQGCDRSHQSSGDNTIVQHGCLVALSIGFLSSAIAEQRLARLSHFG